MGQSLDIFPLIVAVVLGIVSHVVLALMARVVNPLWMLAGVFFLTVPLAVAIDLPGVELIKYARLYSCVLMVVIAIFIYRTYNLRGISLLWVLFVTFYIFAAVWSDLPLGGLIFKGQLLPVTLAGIFAVYMLSSPASFKWNFRAVLILCAVFAAVMAVHLVVRPTSLVNIGRFSPLGMNANHVGAESAAMFLFCCVVATHDRNMIWKSFAVSVGVVFVAVVLASGSRGSALLGAVGLVLIAFPLVKRPGLLVSLAAICAFGLYFLVPEGATDEFSGRGFDNRAHPWSIALSEFSRNPFIGVGWVYNTNTMRESGSTVNLHSMYMQILAETGILGFTLFMVFITLAFFKGLMVLAALRHDKELFPWAFVAAAFIGAPLANGLAESSTIMGSSIKAMMLAMGFAFLDRLPEMARERAAAANLQTEWDAYHQYHADVYAVHQA